VVAVVTKRKVLAAITTAMVAVTVEVAAAAVVIAEVAVAVAGTTAIAVKAVADTTAISKNHQTQNILQVWRKSQTFLFYKQQPINKKVLLIVLSLIHLFIY
jgi:hypothetical protein